MIDQYSTIIYVCERFLGTLSKLKRMAKNLDVFLYDQEQTAAANLYISDI